MKRFLIVVAAFMITTNSFAQSAEDSVKSAVNKMFTAMKSSDKQMLLESFADSAILQTIAKDKNGRIIIKSEKTSDFADQISGLPKGAADERITFDVVKVDADLAIAWTPYQFYYQGKFSHCGVNSFQLIRVNGVWKIQYIIDTRRKESCVGQ